MERERTRGHSVWRERVTDNGGRKRRTRKRRRGRGRESEI